MVSVSQRQRMCFSTTDSIDKHAQVANKTLFGAQFYFLMGVWLVGGWIINDILKKITDKTKLISFLS